MGFGTSTTGTFTPARIKTRFVSLSQTFSANAGDQLSLDYQVQWDDVKALGAGNLAFGGASAVLEGPGDSVFSLFEVERTVVGGGPQIEFEDDEHVGWGTTDLFTFTSTGDYTLTLLAEMRLEIVSESSSISMRTHFDTVVFTAVPEPSTLLLFATGLGLIGYARRKRVLTVEH